MNKIIVVALTLLFVSVLFGASKTESLSAIPELNIISGKHLNHIAPAEELQHEMSRGRHLLDSLYYCDLATATAIGLVSGGTFEGAIRLTPDELGSYTGWDIIAIVFRQWQSSLNNVVKVYDNGTPSSPGPVLTTEPYTSDIPGWKWIDLSSPVTIPGTGDLWCSVEVTHAAGEYPLAVDAGPAVDGKGDWIGPGAWGELQNQGLDYNWQILAIVRLLLDDDVEAVSIDMPSLLPPDTTFNPQATVRNVGLNTNTFDVTCAIEPGSYTSTATATDLAPDESIQVTFPDQYTFPTGEYTVTVYTQLAGDGNPTNDTIIQEVEVLWTDVLPVSIDIPDEVPTDTTFKPQATITNVGSYSEGFLVSCRIEPSGYYKNYSVSDLAPNESLQITFDQNFTFLSGVYTVTVYTRLSDDDDPSNDTLEKVIDATGIAEGDVVTPTCFSFDLKSNPAKGKALFSLALPMDASISLRIYDVSGRLINNLVSERKSAGHYEISWDSKTASGIYFYKFESPWKNEVGKLILVK